NRPGAPDSPKPKVNAVLGAFFGLFLGLLVAFGRDRVDNRLRGRVDLEEYLRAPVLATVPRTRRNGRTAPTLVTMQHPNSPASEMPPWEAVQEPAGLERLWVFGSGPVPAQPAELLQSDLMRELLAERRKVADFVIIEAPAALNASDCLALAPLVDGILVVADAKHTDRDEVEQVRIQF